MENYDVKTKPSSSGETVPVVIREGSPGGRSETTGPGFGKQVGFTPGVKERKKEKERERERERESYG